MNDNYIVQTVVGITVFVICQFSVTSHFTVFRDHQPWDVFDVTASCDSYRQ
jgi:hypothetical protein